jgi:hypothetical protein
MGGGGGLNYGGFNTPYSPYQVPSAADAANMPGYQFMINQGADQLQRSAAAKGTLLTGGALKDLADYTTGTALSQGYLPLANLGLNVSNNNFSNLLARNQAYYGDLSDLLKTGLSASSVGPSSPV